MTSEELIELVQIAGGGFHKTLSSSEAGHVQPDVVNTMLRWCRKNPHRLPEKLVQAGPQARADWEAWHADGLKVDWPNDDGESHKSRLLPMIGRLENFCDALRSHLLTTKPWRELPV